MIVKPSEQEQESRAHAVVGEALRVGGEVRRAGRRGAMATGSMALRIWLALAAFGLLVSSTPLWFKLLGLIVFAIGYRLLRNRRRTDRGEPALPSAEASIPVSILSDLPGGL
jgi:hypothetical protein